MKWPDAFLLCFAVGTLWSVASALLGGLHFGHFHAGHGVAGHGVAGHGHGAPGSGAHAAGQHGHGASQSGAGWFASMINPSAIAVFLAWFGGVGYLLTRHSGLVFWLDVSIAAACGLTGAWLLAAFLRFLQARERPLDPADYEMVGVLGRVSSPIRPGGVGEVLYVRDGTRKPVCALSEDGQPIGRGEEVIVTRYERGMAYVKTWDAMVTKGTMLPPAGEPRA